MRTLVFSMLAMASMVACTSESDPIQEVNDKPVEIKLTAGIITTKAPIESTNDLPKENLSGVQFVKSPDGVSADWTGVNTIATAGTIASADGAIGFSTPLIYNVDRDLKSFIIGYFPSGSINAGVVSWTITGNSDILIAQEVSGSKATPISAPVAFKHMLTQLRFKAQVDAGADWGQITDITIRKADDTNLNTNASYTFSSSAPTSLTWTVPSTDSMHIYKVVNDVYENDKLSKDAVSLSAQSTLIGYTMVEPLGKNEYELVVKTTKSADGIPVSLTLTEDALIGKAYEINLTFAASSISAKATIADWVIVEGGGGKVE